MPVLHEPLGHLGSPWEHHGQVFDTPGQPGLYVGDLITKIDEAPLRGDYDEALGIPGWNMVKHLQLPWWIRFLTSQVVMLWYVMGVGRVFWLKSWETHTHIYNIYIYRMWCWFSTMKNRRGDPDHPCSPCLYLFIYISRTRSAKRSGKDRLFLPCRWRIPLGAISAMEFSWPSRESPEHPTMMFFAMTQVVLVPHGFTRFPPTN